MDAAFKTAAFPGYTTAELKLAIEKGCPDAADPAATIVKMKAEIERRRAVAAKRMDWGRFGRHTRRL